MVSAGLEARRYNGRRMLAVGHDARPQGALEAAGNAASNVAVSGHWKINRPKIS
jgi:hypothetical protein